MFLLKKHIYTYIQSSKQLSLLFPLISHRVCGFNFYPGQYTVNKEEKEGKKMIALLRPAAVLLLLSLSLLFGRRGKMFCCLLLQRILLNMCRDFYISF